MEDVKRNVLGLISDYTMTQMKSTRKRKKNKKKRCDSQERDKIPNNVSHIQQETDTSQTDLFLQQTQQDKNLIEKQQQPDQNQKLGQSFNSQPCFSTETVVNSQQQKDKVPLMKAVTTKTFSKGLMDISLLTSNATQLREVILTPKHPFCDLVFWLILTSIVIQVLSTMLMLLSDYLKSSGVAKDNLARKRLSFVTMALISLVTVLNVLISVFHIPGDFRHSSSKATIH